MGGLGIPVPIPNGKWSQEETRPIEDGEFHEWLGRIGLKAFGVQPQPDFNLNLWKIKIPTQLRRVL